MSEPQATLVLVTVTITVTVSHLVLGYGLDDQAIEVRSLAGVKAFFF
jgi:hypothetical protein